MGKGVFEDENGMLDTVSETCSRIQMQRQDMTELT